MRLRVKDFTTKVGSGVTPRGGAESYQESGIPLFRSQNVVDNGFLMDDIAYISEEIDESMKGSRVKPGDVLLNITGASIGRCYYTSHDFKRGNVNQHVCIIRPMRNVVSPEFLHYNLISQVGKEYIRLSQTGANREGLTIEDIKNFSFEIPPLEEQKLIVDYLDAKTASIDNRATLLEKKRDAYTRLRASVINQAVARGLDSNVKLVESGIEWIGTIPEHWVVKRLKDFISLQKGKTPREFSFDPKDPNSLPYLTMDYLRDRDGKSTLYPEYIDGLLEIEENKIIVLWDGANAGEFIKSKAGYLGSTMAVLLTKGFNENFLFYFLKSIERDSKYYANGTTIPHFDNSVLLNRDYAIPPLYEQKAIAAYLDCKCTEIDAALTNIDKQLNALKRLKRSLINEVITGKRKV